MMLELLQVTFGQLITRLSMTVEDGRMVSISGPQGSGKTTLLRAIMGFQPVDEGYISLDGELLTPLSAPYFRRYMAYVPQQLAVPDDFRDFGLEGFAQLSTDARYLLLLRLAVQSGHKLLLVDEPPYTLASDTAQKVDQLLRQALQQGASVLCVRRSNGAPATGQGLSISANMTDI